MNYPIQIVRVKSRSNGKVYPIAYPSADVDYVTDGLIILASIEKEEIQLHNADGLEYREGPYEGGIIRADKENKKQNRSDLRAVSIDLKVPSISTSKEEYAYHDIYDSNNHADTVEEISITEFLKSGGVVRNER